MKSVPFLLLSAILLIGAPLRAWSPEALQAIAKDSTAYLPPALMGLLSHYPKEFNAGFTEASPATGAAQLEAQIIAAGEALEADMQKAGSLARFARAWGAYLRLTIEAGDPLRGLPLPGAAASDYNRYAGGSLKKIKRAVFLSNFLNGLNEREILDDMRRRTARYGVEITAVYDEQGRRRVALAADGRSNYYFDDKSNLFGVTALSYNHAVSNSTTLLSRLWQRGGGDMTGSPLLSKPAEPAARSEKRAKKADASGFER